jgi:hypothetical protein
MPKLGEFMVGQDREPRERAPNTPVKCRWDSPYASLASTQLLFLWCGVFLETVRRVRDDGVN